ncbi:hypothetical protein J5X84_15550 [Streptosporangiaceae bacterium NEAU-GS5]|nr:hypothetical protein [Streptosporangiaceae bacterium NEAU-GS5]
MRLGDHDGRESVEFELGHAAAVDRRIEADVPAGPAITNITSWWNHLPCGRCGHTFRRGDPVIQDFLAREVIHTNPQLGCGAAESADRGQDDELTAFGAGVLAAWPGDDNAPVTRLTDDDWRSSWSGPPLMRARCLFCAHTFRSGELVIVCPCGPGQPQCGSAVHRDPALGMVCWESWRPDGRIGSCPVTLARRGDDN